MMGKSKQTKRKNMEIDNLNDREGCMKVAVNGSGKGLPYAPVDWPEPGDIWRWKVGNRISVKGYFRDRYLHMPTRLHSTYNCKLRRFTSKRSLSKFITENYPNEDADKVLSSFCWEIPAEKERSIKKVHGGDQVEEFSFESDEVQSDSDAEPGFPIARCKAGNKRCISLVENLSPSGGEANICNMCCRDNTFCRDCSCTICFETIKEGSLDYIRCESTTDKNFVCGHIVHVRCALTIFMAGKVGGRIDLDAECLCRPCDSKNDLIPHVEKILKACQSSSSKEGVEKWLNMCESILKGSMRTKSIELMRFVQLTITKVYI
ncbi:uncharacterized protein LOC124916426 [Impatiens glandulifera]|uniref:uncharacterized protein LOC124916426 n=1 Tax=Impatiens glandulifera TaxID=253017 RepID=UPI001FB04BA4|nr:uncharacterized protein LOC124916426 [Impatiens glandulifera]